MIRLRLQIWGKIITEVMCPSYCIILGSAEYWHGLLQVALIFITQLRGLLLGFFWSYYISCSIIFSLQSTMSGPHSRRRELIFTSSRENYQAIFEHMFKLPQWTFTISGEILILKYANILLQLKVSSSTFSTHQWILPAEIIAMIFKWWWFYITPISFVLWIGIFNKKLFFRFIYACIYSIMFLL